MFSSPNCIEVLWMYPYWLMCLERNIFESVVVELSLSNMGSLKFLVPWTVSLSVASIYSLWDLIIHLRVDSGSCLCLKKGWKLIFEYFPSNWMSRSRSVVMVRLRTSTYRIRALEISLLLRAFETTFCLNRSYLSSWPKDRSFPSRYFLNSLGLCRSRWKYWNQPRRDTLLASMSSKVA